MAYGRSYKINKQGAVNNEEKLIQDEDIAH